MAKRTPELVVGWVVSLALIACAVVLLVMLWSIPIPSLFTLMAWLTRIACTCTCVLLIGAILVFDLCVLGE